MVKCKQHFGDTNIAWLFLIDMKTHYGIVYGVFKGAYPSLPLSA